MDQSRFQEAQQAYDAGDFRTAAKGFLASASRGPDGNGAAYHMAGNALMRLRRHQDAVTVYGHALRDQLYDRRGAVLANLGAAYCELGEYAESARSYESALLEPDYATPYKAHQGMANALLERGRVEEAAIEYRKAALDPGNPDPGKALTNLGLCFMGLGRPGDAVEAYRAALGFDDYKGRGKALANLGQAFVALGEFENAVKSFDKATQMHGYKLSPAAAAAFATAQARSRRPAETHQVVEGWETGKQLPVPPEQAAVATGATSVAVSSVSSANPAAGMPDASTTSPSVADDSLAPLVDPASVDFAAADSALAAELTDSWQALEMADTTMGWDFPDASGAPAPAADDTQSLAPFNTPHRESELGFGDENAVADFFSATDEDLKAKDREARRAARHAKGPFAIWRGVIVACVVVVIAVAALVGIYQLGYGFPTQAQTVGSMLGAFQSGSPVESFWVAGPTKDITKEMAKIPPVKSFTIDNVTQGAKTSTAEITVTPKSGAALHYTITLSREGVGWKVSGVDNNWSSTGG